MLDINNNKLNGVDTISDQEINSITSELESLAGQGGEALSGTDNDQMAKSVAKYVRGRFCENTGDTTDLVLSRDDAMKEMLHYSKGMIIETFLSDTNSGAMSLNLNGIGVANIKDIAGNDIEANAMCVGFVRFVYDGVKFVYMPEQGTPLKGFIQIFNGEIADIPKGWALCDGGNGTPNLQNRFVVGAGDSYSKDDTGGANTVTLSTSQIPSHHHSIPSHHHSANHNHTASSNNVGLTGYVEKFRSVGTASGSGKLSVTAKYDDNGGDGDDGSTYRINLDVSHSHSITVNTKNFNTGNWSGNTGNTGSTHSHENRPPYYALAYIMKL